MHRRSRRPLLIAGLLASSLIGVLAQPSGSYTVVSDAVQDARNPSLALERNGTPVIALVEKVGGVYNAFVRRWNGHGWTQLGAALNRDRSFNAFDIWLALDRADAPVVAWTERSNVNDGKASGPGKVYVARWDGKTWIPFGDSPTRKLSSASDQPRLRLDSRGYPVLAWSELSPDFNAESFFVARWDGARWRIVDPGSLSTDVSGASRSRDLAVTRTDEPMLAWSVQLYEPGKGPLDFNVFVGSWSKQGWTPLGGASLNASRLKYAAAPSLVLDAQDRPVVAFKEADAGFNIRVKRWTGTAWTRLGDTVNGATGLADAPKLALDARGNPTVAYLENAGSLKVMVRRWNSTAWTPLGPISSTGLNADPNAYADFCVIAQSAQGAPVVVWREEVGKLHAVYARRWNGSGWVGLDR